MIVWFWPEQLEGSLLPNTGKIAGGTRTTRSAGIHKQVTFQAVRLDRIIKGEREKGEETQGSKPSGDDREPAKTTPPKKEKEERELT